MKKLQTHIKEIQGRHTDRDVDIDMDEDSFIIHVNGLDEVTVPFTEVFMPTVDAETNPHKNKQQDYFNGDLSADCPHCGEDGYVSTGEHPAHGEDVVICSFCVNAFKIEW